MTVPDARTLDLIRQAMQQVKYKYAMLKLYGALFHILKTRMRKEED